MTTKPSYTPALRFPDFLNDGEWEVKRLGEIAKVVDEKCNIGKLNIETYISTENMLQNLEGVKKATKLPDTGSFTRFQKGDILFSNIRPYLKKVWQAEFDGAASNDVIVFRALSGFDFHFVSQIIKSDSFIAHTMAGAKGVKMPRGDKNMMMDYLVCIPSLAEQRRIAACLSALDEMLAATNEKLEQMKAYKKGLMQKLFVDSMGGGKSLKINYLQISKLRFPEFYDEKEWEEKILGECFSERTERNYNDLPLLSLTESDGIVLQEETNRKNNSNADKSKYLRVCVGDIAYNTMRMWQGRCAIVNIEGIVSPAYTICKPKQEMDSLFFYYYFKTNDAIEKFHRNSQGLVNDTLNLKYESFEKIKMFVPSLSEQHKIASCLSSMDETINAYTEKAGLLGQYKKGLMQQMFVN